MTHTLMKLPFDEGALEPYISRETIQYHFGKHHTSYVIKLNALIKDTVYDKMTLEEIIKQANGGIFNNASQVYNHDFYFNGLSNQKSKRSQLLEELITRDFVGKSDEFHKITKKVNNLNKSKIKKINSIQIPTKIS